MPEIRHRNVRKPLDTSSMINEADMTEVDVDRDPVFLLSPGRGFILFSIWCSGILLAGLHFNDKLPYAPSVVTDRYEFNHHNVLKDLKILTSFGPKVTGSDANEYKAVDFLVNRITDIQSKALTHHKISYDVQNVSGRFSLNIFSHNYLLTYENIQNVIVKIEPKYGSNHSLLINCHFDSVPTSPGASDDGLNCAVMIEILRILAISEVKLPHNIVFLFNGAEENPLLGSHGFITQHKWANTVKAFINLESCGAGGREVLFQAGPYHPWLIKLYGQAAKYPSGLVVAEEIFQSGLIPSDTDFRIFRDHGNIPGLDFAHCKNGYVYHTKLDNIDSIESPQGVIKHTGENILSLSKSILFSEEFMDPPKYKKGKQVYFDLFGLIFINYSDDFGLSLNIFTSFVSFLGIYLTILNYENGNIYVIILKLLLSVVILLTSIIVIMSYNSLIAFILDFFGHSMSWYKNPGLLIPIYVLPSAVILILSTAAIDKFILGNIAFNAKTQLVCLNVQLLWTIFLFISIFFNVRSSFLLLIIILPCALWTLITSLLKFRLNYKIWYTMLILVSSFASMMFCYLGITCMRLFIPITGRMGVSKNPEFLIGLLTTLLSVAVLSYISTLFIHVKKTRTVIKLMLGLHFLSFFIITSPLGFPFSVETPQRILATHVNRQFFNSEQTLEYADSLYWIQNVERRGRSVLPFLQYEPLIEELCEKNGYCGLPYFSKLKESSGSTSVLSVAHELGDDLKFELVSKELSGNEFSLEFRISGPDHIGIIITPSKNTTLLSWNLPSPIEQTSNSIAFIQGLGNSSQSIALEAMKSSNDSFVKVEVYGLYFHHERYFSSNFNKYLLKFPVWSHVSPALAVYRFYIF